MRRDNVRPEGIGGVARPGQRSAAAARDAGIRRISRFTWRAGAVGVVCSALIAVAFGHHAAAQQPRTGNGGNSGQGTIVIPAQPPAPAPGAGQVTSGAS
jgi:hypothetical protein